MKKIGRLLMICMSIAMLASCGGGNKAPKETTSGDLPENGTTDALAICITEGGLPLTKEAIDKRFADYAELGVTCVRIDTFWDTSEKGVWKMSDTTKWHLEAARKYGLTLKLILPTIMAPPAWLSADENSRLKDSYGRLSYNTVSYWYDGLCEYTDMALRAQLSAIMDAGYADIIGGIVVDMGPAGEPLYPPAWTQPVTEGIDVSGEVMWCYGDNAQADFREKMTAKYGDIASANAAWRTDFESFDDVKVPYEGETLRTFWRDTMEWYRDTKREFCSAQVDVFKTVVSEMGLADCPLILYLPGADVTEEEWEENIKNKSASAGMRMCCDNQFVAVLAAEKGCVLQYTGINDTERLSVLVSFMQENGLTVPVYGENAGDNGLDVRSLARTVIDYGLAGIDYTHARWIYENDGVTRNDIYSNFATAIEEIKENMIK